MTWPISLVDPFAFIRKLWHPLCADPAIQRRPRALYAASQEDHDFPIIQGAVNKAVYPLRSSSTHA